jgi:type IV pilus assembly protein PilB
MSASPKPAARLGDWLLDQGHVTQTQLDLALREQKRKGGMLGEVLVELGFVSGSVLASFLASKTQGEFVELATADITPELIGWVPESLARRFTAVPVAFHDGVLKVAIADPLNVLAFDALEQATKQRIELVAASESDILQAIDRHYANAGRLDQLVDELLKLGSETLANTTESDAPMIRLADRIIGEAVTLGASDIHIQPEEKFLRVRWRRDGILQPGHLIPKELQLALAARFKILGRMDIADTHRPQGGRCNLTVAGREVGLRLSSLPTSFGESVVIRLLDRSSSKLGLERLGMEAAMEKQFRDLLNRPYGVILVTGPTGSGKTTTLYAALAQINAAEKSVFTLEDPIEYQLPLVRQTQVNEAAGLTFAEGLRTLLRQDPDVILIGETRDSETAQLMVRAALTGHLVFSTLHTNDSLGAVPRLTDLGAEPYLLAPTLAGVIGQRLVRRLCPECRKPVADPRSALARLNIPIPAELPPTLWEARGCAACHDTGYSGRLGIYELFVVQPEHQSLIANTRDHLKLHQAARDAGFEPMLRDGVHKAMRGLTSLSEVLRVIRC